MNYKIIAAAIFWFFISSNIAAQDKPNIVLVFMDNFGWCEIGAYGSGIEFFDQNWIPDDIVKIK